MVLLMQSVLLQSLQKEASCFLLFFLCIDGTSVKMVWMVFRVADNVLGI